MVNKVAPTTVLYTPRSNIAAEASGISGSMTTAWVSLTTVVSANTPALANWKAFAPPTVNGALRRPAVSRQWVGWPRSQAAHCPQLPRVVSTT